jgi:hypothetical protein
MATATHTSGPGWWEGWPWRLIQTNLREVDMADIDAARFVASLKELDATAAMINTSGIIASYPTALPFHTPSTFLHGDDLAMIIDACHAAGIKVIARTDFSKVRRELYERHPEWASVRADGQVVEDAGDVLVCPCGTYQKECAPRIVEETITVLDVDGIFFNMAGFQTHDYRGVDHGICHCEACVAGFRDMFALALPTSRDLDDPVFRRYLVFQDRTLRASKARMDALIRRLRPDMAIDRPSDDRGGFARQESSTALDRTPPEWPYSASANTKWVVSSVPRTVSSNSSVDFVDYPVRHVSVSPDRQRRRLAQALANGGGLDFYVIGRLDDRHDRSSFAAVHEMFAFHAAHEEEYRDLRSCARTALITGRHGSPEEFRGWFGVLAEHHFLFDTLLIDRAEGSLLSRYDTLIVPDHQPVPDEIAANIDRFVEDGGTLVATGRTGWRDGELEPRPAPALACLGIDGIREVREVRGAYLEIDDRTGFPRLAGTDLIFVDGVYVDAGYRPGARRRLRLIPPGPFGPPERCMLPTATDEPGLVIHPYGSGRVLYLPWSCGALVDRHGQANTSSFAADVLECHAGLEPLGGNLPAMVEVTLSERSGRRVHLLHLVNNSGSWGPADGRPVPMHDLEIVIPFDAEPVGVTALVAGRTLDWHAKEGDRLAIRVPALDLFEAIRIERA